MNPVVHFDIPCDDRERVARFFEQAFDWKVQKLGPEMGDYMLATTAEHDTRPDAFRGAINEGDRSSMLQPLPMGR